MDEPVEPIPELPSPLPDSEISAEVNAQQKKITIIIILVAVALLLITIVSFVLLMNANARSVAQLRDVLIIFLAIQSLFMGFVLVVLIIQLSRLINLLNNEIRPILESTNETVSNLRGTTTFLSNNLVEPVIRLNEYLAGLTKLLFIMGLNRKKK